MELFLELLPVLKGLSINQPVVHTMFLRVDPPAGASPADGHGKKAYRRPSELINEMLAVDCQPWDGFKEQKRDATRPGSDTELDNWS